MNTIAHYVQPVLWILVVLVGAFAAFVYLPELWKNRTPNTPEAQRQRALDKCTSRLMFAEMQYENKVADLERLKARPPGAIKPSDLHHAERQVEVSEEALAAARERYQIEMHRLDPDVY